MLPGVNGVIALANLKGSMSFRAVFAWACCFPSDADPMPACSGYPLCSARTRARVWRVRFEWVKEELESPPDLHSTGIMLKSDCLQEISDYVSAVCRSITQIGLATAAITGTTAQASPDRSTPSGSEDSYQANGDLVSFDNTPGLRAVERALGCSEGSCGACPIRGCLCMYTCCTRTVYRLCGALRLIWSPVGERVLYFSMLETEGS